MIIDSLKNAALYEGLHPRFARAFDFVRHNDLVSMKPGRYDIDGDDIFLTLSDSELKLPENAPLEVHDAYIDIQVVFDGVETYGWLERSHCGKPRGTMDTTKDVLFCDDKPSTWFTLHSGEFCILFPSDAHAPMVGTVGSTVRKCIVKVRK